jgi:hypothetical protein
LQSLKKKKKKINLEDWLIKRCMNQFDIIIQIGNCLCRLNNLIVMVLFGNYVKQLKDSTVSGWHNDELISHCIPHMASFVGYKGVEGVVTKERKTPLNRNLTFTSSRGRAVLSINVQSI